MEAKKENNFDKHYIQPLKRGCSGLNRTKLIFCKHALIKTKCGADGCWAKRPRAQVSSLLTSHQGQDTESPKTYCLPCTGFLEMVPECGVGCARPGSLYPPLPIVCFTRLQYLLGVQSQVHLQGLALDPVLITVTKLLRREEEGAACACTHTRMRVRVHSSLRK